MNVYLTAAQAQQIVFQLLEVIPGEISVTDESGSILGTSNKNLLKKQSKLAQKCVEQTTSQLPYNECLVEGNKIAVPLQFRDVCVGVILIKGDVERIKRLTSIAKAVGESIIYTPYIKDTEHVWDVINFEFLTEWLNTTGAYSLSLIRRGIQQGIDIVKPHVVVIMDGIWNILSAQKAIEGILTQSNYYVCQSKHSLILILTENYDKEILNQICSHFSDVHIAVGEPDPSLYRSYMSAQSAMYVGTHLHPDKMIYHFSEYELEYALSSISKIDFSNGINELFCSASYEDLRQTLEVFFEVGGNQTEAINRLFIHRNTMKYRLDRIQELTSKNPRVFHDLFYLYVAYVLHKFKDSINEEKEETDNEESGSTDPELHNAVDNGVNELRTQ